MSKKAGIHLRNLVFEAMLLIASFAAFAETLTGRVVGMADGDTITVLDANRAQHRIRLGGIDPPEKAQPFGQRSKESLSAMIFGKEVDVQWHKHDRYLSLSDRVNYTLDYYRLWADVPKALGQIPHGNGVDLSVRWVLTERLFLLGVTGMA